IANVPGIKALAHGRKYIGYATGTDHHNGGPAVLGDGGQREPYLTPQGRFGVSPNVPTLFANLPKGTKVWPSIKAFKEQVGHFAKGTNEVWVDGYYRDNGTYVKGYWRKKPKSHSTKSGSSKKTKTRTIIKYVTRPAANNKTLSKEAKKQKAAAAAKKKAAELSKKISDSISTIITDYRAGKISAKTERARLEAIQKNHKLTATQRNRIVAAIGASSKAIAKQISSYNNAIGNAINKFDSTMKTIRTTYNNAVADAKKTYQSALNENRNTAYTTFAMFDKAEQSKVSGVGLLRNLKSQNSLYKKFTSNIKKLQRRGASKKMINELLQQGPSANADVEALLSLSASDWKSYKGAYSEKTKTANALGDLTTSYGAAKTDLNKALKTAKAKYQSSVNDAVNTLGNAMKSANKKYKSTGITLSGHFVSGIVNGLKKSQKDVSSAAEKIAHNIENSIRKRLDIHSPSRVAVRLMGFFGDGLVNGLTGSISNVSRAALHVSDSITKNIIPIDGTAAINGLQKMANASIEQLPNKKSESNTNRIEDLLTKILFSQERTNQLLQSAIGQNMNTNEGNILKTLAKFLNEVNGNALGINSYMQGG
ncbi:TPA: phage tail tape measure protein, partial [Pseudomonas aeruginosa]|nr:phage tail tape measure protein [Pseudomonas aeruginosa]